ncbi:COG4223 family protein [Methylocella sp.]|uniref:COG4223 family protein n=1 Tax=Methylocella sp. TaxID=1978226 RepID=UPI00378486CA
MAGDKDDSSGAAAANEPRPSDDASTAPGATDEPSGEAEPREPATGVAPAAPDRRPSRLPLLLGALVVGALGGAGADATLRYLEKTSGPDPVASVNARTVELDKKVAAASASLAALQARVDAAEKTAANMKSSLPDDVMDAARAAAAKAESAAATAQDVAKQAEASASSAAEGARRVLDAPAPPQPDLGPLNARLDEVAAKLEGFESRVAGHMQDLGSRLESVEAKGAELKVDEEARKALEATTATIKERDAAYSVALLAAMLREHVASGAPFANDLAALQEKGVDPARLNALKPYADSGVVKLVALEERFAALTPSLELKDPPKDLSIIDRLKHDALNLVRVRREADPADDDIPGRLAAISAELKRGELARAYELWSKLPEDVKAKSAKWGEAAKARLAAVAAAKAIEADAVKASAKTKS